MVVKIEIPVGTRFGHWTTTSPKYRVPNKNSYVVEAKCDCGREQTLYATQLTGGYSRRCVSCGRRGRPIQTPKEYVVSQVYGWYRKSAKKRGIPFEVTKEFFGDLLFRDCYYCGVQPKNKTVDRMGLRELPRYGGVDRVDNSVGYLEDNIVPSCRWCNEAKKAKSEAEFLSWIEGIKNGPYDSGDRASSRKNQGARG